MKLRLVGGVACENVGPVQIGACARLPFATVKPLKGRLSPLKGP